MSSRSGLKPRCSKSMPRHLETVLQALRKSPNVTLAAFNLRYPLISIWRRTKVLHSMMSWRRVMWRCASSAPTRSCVTCCGRRAGREDGQWPVAPDARQRAGRERCHGAIRFPPATVACTVKPAGNRRLGKGVTGRGRTGVRPLTWIKGVGGQGDTIRRVVTYGVSGICPPCSGISPSF